MSNTPADDDEDDYLYGPTSGDAKGGAGGAGNADSTGRGAAEAGKDAQSEVVDDDDELYDLYGDNIANENPSISNEKSRPTPENTTGAIVGTPLEIQADISSEQDHHNEDQNGQDAEDNGEPGRNEVEGSEEDEEEDESDDDIEIILNTGEDPRPETPSNANGAGGRRNSLVNIKPAQFGKGQANNAPRQDGVTQPPPTTSRASAGVDLNAVGQYDGQSIYDVDLDSFEEKSWRKPGADITDYFNYGFNEHTWRAYCAKQKAMRDDQFAKRRINVYESKADGMDLPPELQGLGMPPQPNMMPHMDPGLLMGGMNPMGGPGGPGGQGPIPQSSANGRGGGRPGFVPMVNRGRGGGMIGRRGRDQDGVIQVVSSEREAALEEMDMMSHEMDGNMNDFQMDEPGFPVDFGAAPPMAMNMFAPDMGPGGPMGPGPFFPPDMGPGGPMNFDPGFRNRPQPMHGGASPMMRGGPPMIMRGGGWGRGTMGGPGGPIGPGGMQGGPGEWGGIPQGPAQGQGGMGDSARKRANQGMADDDFYKRRR